MVRSVTVIDPHNQAGVLLSGLLHDLLGALGRRHLDVLLTLSGGLPHRVLYLCLIQDEWLPLRDLLAVHLR